MFNCCINTIIIFDTTFHFVRHVDFIVNKLTLCLIFTMRSCADVNTASVLNRFIFQQLGLTQNLNPNFDVHVNRIESIQKTFYSFLLKKMWLLQRKLAPYLFKLNIKPLSVRRKNTCVFLCVFDTHFDLENRLA